MSEIKQFIETLFSTKGIVIPQNRKLLFEDFFVENKNIDLVNTVLEKQNELMNNWKIKSRIAEITEKQIVIPNATMGKTYSHKLDLEKQNLSDIQIVKLLEIEKYGLSFDLITGTITGIPQQSGDLKFTMQYKFQNDELLNDKTITLVVNPDPKTLWKDIPSDKNDKFWKEDDISKFDILGDKKIVVSSKRGRSHKNVGSFRDDDFSYNHFTNSGWSLIAVSDGAGSYSLSRVGSQIACKSVIEYFEQHSDIEKENEFESKLLEYNKLKDETLLKEIEILAKQNLYKATVYVHNKIKAFAEETAISNPELFNNPKAKTSLDYFHSTFIFALFKKYEFGYVVLTFGVGDCPIAIINTERTESTLMNWLDVGEFGGGTRFITQPEIFHSKEHPMATRFNFKIIQDFSFLFLMTDGIYDPKFVVEANLEKHEKWIEFLEDLQGKNEDKCSVEFTTTNTDIATQLSIWMDFWSAGNHDDRTLAIVY